MVFRQRLGWVLVVADLAAIAVASVLSYALHRAVTFRSDPYVRWVEVPAAFVGVALVAAAVDVVVLRAVFAGTGFESSEALVEAKVVALAAAGVVRLLGYRCRYAADAVVRHHGSVPLGRTSAFAVFQGQRNLEWLYLKNSPLSILLRSMPGHLLYTAAAAGYFARLGLLGAFLRAKLAAVAGVPRVLRQRALVQRTRRVGAGAIWPLLERRWLATKWREKRFDVGLAGER